jgi:carboxyl-terminal processing protease
MRLDRRLVAPALVAGVAFISGGWLLRHDAGRGDGSPAAAHLLAEVMQHVSQDYVEPKTVDELYRLSAQGVVSALHDPHSVLMSPEEYAALHTQTSGEFAGLGIGVAVREGWPTATSVLPGTPAQRAGMRVGDHMVRIGGADTHGWSADSAVKRLRGPKGSAALLVVERPGVDGRMDFRIVRDEIHVKSVPYAYMLDGSVGYVNLSVFADSSTAEIRAAMDRLRAQGMRGLVFDLRGNPGGLLDQGASVADLFLPRGKTIVQTRARDPRENETFVAETPESYAGLPVVVLVDDYSASAAEIVSGALQDHDRALVMGQTSYGKGSVQSIFPLSGGNVLKMTTARWYTPSGRSIQKPHEADDEDAAGEDGEDADTSSAAAAPGGHAAARDTAKRQAYHTDSGRVVYGGGGIVPDVEVLPDTATTAEQAFFAGAARSGRQFNDVLFRYGLDYARAHPQLARSFAVTPEMRREVFGRLRAAGVDVSWAQVTGAAKYVDARIADEIATARFGPEAAEQRIDAADNVVQAAVRLLHGAPDQATLLRQAGTTRTRRR